MINTEISEILEQTARLLEYCEGRSSFVDELLDISVFVTYLEVPLEVFANISNSKQDEREFTEMLNYWFGGFSIDAQRIFRDVVVTGDSQLRSDLQRETSPSVIPLLKLKCLSSDSIHFIRDRLNIRNIDALKKACGERFLSGTGEFSEREELEILEEIISLQETESSTSRGTTSDDEVWETLEDKLPTIADPDTMFWANADALAQFIVANLTQPLKQSIKQTVEEFISSEKLSDVKEGARNILGKIRRFFLSRNNPTYARLLFQEKSRVRERSIRREEAWQEESFDAVTSQPLNIAPVGAVSRGRDVISRLEFLINTNEPRIAFERIKKSGFIKEVVSEGRRLLIATLNPNSFTMPFNSRPTPEVPLYFYACSDFVYGTYETLLTSSKSHWNELKQRALLRGYRLTSFGLYEGARRISSRAVDRLYKLLDLPVIPKELREGRAEWEWVDSGTPDLVSLEDVRGDMHAHTTFTDGAGDIQTMCSAAREQGLSYIALTDHTKNVASVGGMNDVEFLRYWDAVDNFNDKLKELGIPFYILKGAEVDILEDGGLDLEDSTLAQADWVVASVHFGKRQPRTKIHSRYMDAFLNPYVDVIAHPTGRIIGVEPKIDVDVNFLCENASKYGKYIEINSQPRRLDLSCDSLTLAKRYGVKVVISTDAHSPEQIGYLRFGVQQARRAGLTSDDVLNCMSVREILDMRTHKR